MPRYTKENKPYKNCMSGLFKPLNPDKYRGKVEIICYRSGWELKMMVRLDKDPNVIAWSSESIAIPYRHPIDGQIHTYFPDFWVKHIENGKVKETVYEVKPKIQCSPPKPKKQTKKYIKEVFTYGINEAKWKSAVPYCKSKGWEFKIITEHDLGIKYGRK